MKDPKRILLFDTGNEWGGGTNSMIELLKRIDRTRFAVTACFYHNYRQGDSTLQDALTGIDIPLVILPTRSQPLWAKLAKELARRRAQRLDVPPLPLCVDGVEGERGLARAARARDDDELSTGE